MTKDRIHWIDIAKGLMIIGMVLNHIPYCNRLGVNISSFPWWLTFGNAYGGFTMQSLSGLRLAIVHSPVDIVDEYFKHRQYKPARSTSQDKIILQK